MQRQLKFAFVLLAPLLIAAGQPEGGCDDGALPSAKQIELSLPPALLECPGLPVSPGEGATKQQTAVYLTKLYNVARQCSQNNKAVAKIVRRYEAQAARLSRAAK
jgi:hypothetical protein